jgi:hypothetical protein
VEGESSSEKDLEDHVYIPTANKTRRKKQTHSSLANNYQLGGAFRVEFSRSVIAVLRPPVSFVCSRRLLLLSCSPTEKFARAR